MKDMNATDESKNYIRESIQKGDIKKAKELLDIYKSTYDLDVDIQSFTAVAAIMEGRLDEGEAILLDTLSGYSTNADVLFNLGYVYKLKGNMKKALEYFNESCLITASKEAADETTQVINETEIELIKQERERLTRSDTEASLLIEKAERALAEENDEEAFEYYRLLLTDQLYRSLAYYRLGEICNRLGRPIEAYRYHMNAFTFNPKLVQLITSNNHIHYNYVYKEAEEVQITECPLCGSKGVPKYSFNTVTNLDFIPDFNPVRLWMFCSECNHIFAKNYPVDLFGALTEYTPPYYLKTNNKALHLINRIVHNIKRYTKGNRMLEVGLGSGEMTALAKEYLFDVTGIELRMDYAQKIAKMLDITVHSIDFLKYDSSDKYDVICMGDVLEHMTNPVGAIKKAHSLLEKGGTLWISTPNFESAFSYIMKDKDPMWRVCEHLNYFSFKSLKKLLLKFDMEIIDYSASDHYNGSMEVIARKI